MSDLTGKVGECGRGRLGLITGQKELPWGLSWVGVGLDDGTQWASRSPRVLTLGEVGAIEAKVPA